jgi:hypothetical protein
LFSYTLDTGFQLPFCFKTPLQNCRNNTLDSKNEHTGMLTGSETLPAQTRGFKKHACTEVFLTAEQHTIIIANHATIPKCTTNPDRRQRKNKTTPHHYPHPGIMYPLSARDTPILLTPDENNSKTRSLASSLSLSPTACQGYGELLTRR